MNQGKYVFTQVIEFINQYQFNICVDRYKGNYKVRNFTCWDQFLALSFGQLTFRDSLRSIIICLNSQRNKLYHLGFRSKVAKTNLLRANEKRDWRIYQDFAQLLIKEARKLYKNDKEFEFDIDNTIYALDATTIDVCLNVFKWAKYKRAAGAVRVHTLMDLRGHIPTFIHITNAKFHEINTLDLIEFENGAFYIMDMAYTDFERFYKMNNRGAFFVTRAKDNMKFKRLYSNKIDKTTGLRCDQIIKMTGPKTSKLYPEKLRRIKYYDDENDQYYVFITNNFNLDAKLIANLYKARWQIEIFFKWIKQNLRIKVFWGHSENAVKIQIWIAICIYLAVAIMKKRLQINRNLYEILQILSITPFEKIPLNKLFDENYLQNFEVNDQNQLSLLDI